MLRTEASCAWAYRCAPASTLHPAGYLISCAYTPWQDGADGQYTVHFNSYEDGGKVGKPESVEVDVVIGADGANSRVAKEIDAGEYDYAIAFQERIRIPEDKMDYYKDLAEMYVGDDVSPDFYGWVFPKYDHVAVGASPDGLLFWC